MEELSDDRRQANYCHLLETIAFIEKNERITEDWIELQKEFIQDVKNFFICGFQTLNPEIKNKEFRILANETETIINSLITSIQYDNTFKVKHYSSFLNRLLNLFQRVHEFHGSGEELSGFMNNMSLG